MTYNALRNAVTNRNGSAVVGQFAFHFITLKIITFAIIVANLRV